jgi:hypothetical protein
MVRLISNLDNIKERTYTKIKAIIEPEFYLDGIYLVYHDSSNKNNDACKEDGKCALFEFAESIGDLSIYYDEDFNDYDFSSDTAPATYEYVLMNINLIPEHLFEKVMRMAKKLEEHDFKVTIAH